MSTLTRPATLTDEAIAVALLHAQEQAAQAGAAEFGKEEEARALESNRAAPRHRVLKSGSIEFNGGTIDCVVRNLTNLGACVHVRNAVSLLRSWWDTSATTARCAACRTPGRRSRPSGQRRQGFHLRRQQPLGPGPERRQRIGVRAAHPLWLDTFDVAAQLMSWRQAGQRILWLCSRDSFFSSVLKDRRDPTSLLVTRPADQETDDDLFDACLCELGPSELSRLPALYRRIRTLVRNGGKVLVHINNPYAIPVGMGQLAAYDAVFPETSRCLGIAAADRGVDLVPQTGRG